MKELYFDFSNLANFPAVVHGISTREYGNMKMKAKDDPQVIRNRERFAATLGINLDTVVIPEIVHSNKIVSVGRGERGAGARSWQTTIRGADGLVTDQPGVNLAVTVADCLPILVYDPVQKVVGIAHAGWRGILDGIVDELIAKFESYGSSVDNLIVGVGPSICQKHFVVKKDVLALFAKKNAKAVLLRNKDGYVDLRRVVADELLGKGIAKVNLELADECTICNQYYFSSFRAEKDKTIFQAAIIGLRG